MDKLIDVTINTGSIYCNAVKMSELELDAKKLDLRKSALQFLAQHDVDYIVYYHDNRNSANEITRATLHYNMIGLSTEEFKARSKCILGKVEYVSKVESDQIDVIDSEKTK